MKTTFSDNDLCLYLNTNNQRTPRGTQNEIRKETKVSFADDAAYMINPEKTDGVTTKAPTAADIVASISAKHGPDQT